MSETRAPYSTTLFTAEPKRATMSTELDLVRAELEELERRLIPLLVTVQRALGKEPTILTRSERRGR